MNRPGLIWNRNIEAEEKRTKEYLYIAFQKCMERMEKEHISSFAEYDERYSIHYQCEECIGELCRLLQENNDTVRYEEVKKFRISTKTDNLQDFEKFVAFVQDKEREQPQQKKKNE